MSPSPSPTCSTGPACGWRPRPARRIRWRRNSLRRSRRGPGRRARRRRTMPRRRTAPPPAGELQKGLVVAKTPHNSPWRTFIIGRQPCDLIQSDLVLEPRHPEPARRHLLDQAGHVVLGHLVARHRARTTSPRSNSTSNLPPTWAGRINCRRSATSRSCPSWWPMARNGACASGCGIHFNDFIDSAVYKRDFPMYCEMGHCGAEDRLH